MISDQLIATVVAGVFVYAAIGGFISGVWISIYPPDNRWGRETIGPDVFFSGAGWPITLVCLTATAGYHVGIATIRMCKDFLRIPEKPS